VCKSRYVFDKIIVCEVDRVFTSIRIYLPSTTLPAYHTPRTRYKLPHIKIHITRAGSYAFTHLQLCTKYIRVVPGIYLTTYIRQVLISELKF